MAKLINLQSSWSYKCTALRSSKNKYHSMTMPIDPMGNISLILQVVILFVLILGLPFASGAENKKSFIRHGYLTVFALVLHGILIFVVMIPTFAEGIVDITSLSPSFNN